MCSPRCPSVLLLDAPALLDPQADWSEQPEREERDPCDAERESWQPQSHRHAHCCHGPDTGRRREPDHVVMVMEQRATADEPDADDDLRCDAARVAHGHAQKCIHRDDAIRTGTRADEDAGAQARRLIRHQALDADGTGEDGCEQDFPELFEEESIKHRMLVYPSIVAEFGLLREVSSVILVSEHLKLVRIGRLWCLQLQKTSTLLSRETQKS